MTATYDMPEHKHLARIESLVLDLDNTLVDSLAISVRRHQRFASYSGTGAVSPPELAEILLQPISHRDKFMACHPGTTEREYRDYLTWRETQAINDSIADPFPGCVQRLRLLKERGFSITVCTDRMFGVRATLSYIGILEYLDSYITGQDLPSGKASDDGIEFLLHTLLPGVLGNCSVDPSRLLFIDDSSAFIAALEHRGWQGYNVDPSQSRAPGVYNPRSVQWTLSQLLSM